MSFDKWNGNTGVHTEILIAFANEVRVWKLRSSNNLDTNGNFKLKKKMWKKNTCTRNRSIE